MFTKIQPTNDKHGVTIIVKSLKSSHRTEVNAFAILIVLDSYKETYIQM